METFVRVPGRSAEDALRYASGLGGEFGLAVPVGLIMGVGPLVVRALAEHGPVLVEVPISRPGPEVSEAVRRLGRLGAAWVVVDASSGVEAVSSGVAAAAGVGVRVAAATLQPSIDDAASLRLFGGSRGSVVSRLSRAAVGVGAVGVMCTLSDLGVVAGLEAFRFAFVGSRDELEEAGRRGADAALVTDPGIAAGLIE